MVDPQGAAMPVSKVTMTIKDVGIDILTAPHHEDLSECVRGVFHEFGTKNAIEFNTAAYRNPATWKAFVRNLSGPIGQLVAGGVSPSNPLRCHSEAEVEVGASLGISHRYQSVIEAVEASLISLLSVYPDYGLETFQGSIEIRERLKINDSTIRTYVSNILSVYKDPLSQNKFDELVDSVLEAVNGHHSMCLGMIIEIDMAPLEQFDSRFHTIKGKRYFDEVMLNARRTGCKAAEASYGWEMGKV